MTQFKEYLKEAQGKTYSMYQLDTEARFLKDVAKHIKEIS